jgi:hypothetical protein
MITRCASFLLLALLVSSNAWADKVIKLPNGQIVTVNARRDFIIERPECAFGYSTKVGAQIRPTLERMLGKNLVHWNANDPAIIMYRTRIKLSYHETTPGITDGDDLVVEYDPCQRTVVKSYFEPSPEAPY